MENINQESKCRCKTVLNSELDMRDEIREVVMSKIARYNSGDIAKVLEILAMYPSFATVEEVVCSMKEYYDEVVHY